MGRSLYLPPDRTSEGKPNRIEVTPTFERCASEELTHPKDNGFVLYLKRLERGRFQLPVVSDRTKCVTMEAAQVAMLLDGIDLNARRLARWTPERGEGIDTDRQL